jgi:hypothetical protein
MENMDAKDRMRRADSASGTWQTFYRVIDLQKIMNDADIAAKKQGGEIDWTVVLAEQFIWACQKQGLRYSDMQAVLQEFNYLWEFDKGGTSRPIRNLPGQ